MKNKTRMATQMRLGEQEVKYSYGPYNKSNDKEQWVRLTEGCPHNCPYCYEPQEQKVFTIPSIVRTQVKIMDMNLLCKEGALDIIKTLGCMRVNGKVVHYELICGLDYRFLTQEIADALKEARFKNLRIAWDWWYVDQFKIKKALDSLQKAGFKLKEIMIFMICNWKIPYSENLKKLDLCKVWGVKVGDCWFDNQTSPKIIPEFWIGQEIKDFRHKVRKHNQLVIFKIDPELCKNKLKNFGDETPFDKRGSKDDKQAEQRGIDKCVKEVKKQLADYCKKYREPIKPILDDNTYKLAVETNTVDVWTCGWVNGYELGRITLYNLLEKLKDETP